MRAEAGHGAERIALPQGVGHLDQPGVEDERPRPHTSWHDQALGELQEEPAVGLHGAGDVEQQDQFHRTLRPAAAEQIYAARRPAAGLRRKVRFRSSGRRASTAGAATA